MLQWYGTLLQYGWLWGWAKTWGYAGKRLFRKPGKSRTLALVIPAQEVISQLKQSWLPQRQWRKQITSSGLCWTRVLFVPYTRPIHSCLQTIISRWRRPLATTPLFVSSEFPAFSRYRDCHLRCRDPRTLAPEIHSRRRCLCTPTNRRQACQRDRLSHDNLSPRSYCP